MAAPTKFIKQIISLDSESTKSTKLSQTKSSIFTKSASGETKKSELATHIQQVPGHTVIGIFRRDNSRVGRVGSSLPAADNVVVLFEHIAETGTAVFEALHSRSYGGRIAGIYDFDHVTNHLKVKTSLNQYVGVLSNLNYDERAFYQVSNDKAEQILTDISNLYGNDKYLDGESGAELFKAIQGVLETQGYAELKGHEVSSGCFPQ